MRPQTPYSPVTARAHLSNLPTDEVIRHRLQRRDNLPSGARRFVCCRQEKGQHLIASRAETEREFHLSAHSKEFLCHQFSTAYQCAERNSLYVKGAGRTGIRFVVWPLATCLGLDAFSAFRGRSVVVALGCCAASCATGGEAAAEVFSVSGVKFDIGFIGGRTTSESSSVIAGAANGVTLGPVLSGGEARARARGASVGDTCFSNGRRVLMPTTIETVAISPTHAKVSVESMLSLSHQSSLFRCRESPQRYPRGSRAGVRAGPCLDVPPVLIAPPTR
jgi:hypothetical protein